MRRRLPRIRLGMRTIKTVISVVISMILVEILGTTDSKLIFAMLGATAAMEPTFRESLDACVAQVVGVLFGAVAGVVLLRLPLPPLAATGVGIALVIVLYNALGIRFSPSMPIFMVVLICTSPDIEPMTYALGRIWDSAIGLGVGMLINTLVFPYDNSRQIRSTAESLDRELIVFLEQMFDGDDVLPDADDALAKIDAMAAQLNIFSNQWLPMRQKGQRRELWAYRLCERKAREMLAHMEVLSQMETAGCLNEENRARLIACGAKISQREERCVSSQISVVTNYHVEQILRLRIELRRELLIAMKA